VASTAELADRAHWVKETMVGLAVLRLVLTVAAAVVVLAPLARTGLAPLVETAVMDFLVP